LIDAGYDLRHLQEAHTRSLWQQLENLQCVCEFIQALSQLSRCRQQLDEAVAEKLTLEANVARLTDEHSQSAARLRLAEVIIFESHFIACAC